MIAAVVTAAALAGWSALLVWRLAPGLRTLPALAAAGGLGVAAACWLPFGLARAAGLDLSLWLAPLVASAGFLLEVAAAARPGSRGRARRRLRALGLQLVRRRSRTALALLAGLTLFHAWGHRRHCLDDRDGAYWSAGAAWEDQAFHAALATSFSRGDNLIRLGYPHVPDRVLAYPFLPDFQAGWLEAAGVPLPAAFALGNATASAVFLLAAFCLLRGWLGGRGRALTALGVWHVAGGFGLAYAAVEAGRLGSLAAAFGARDYANDWDLELHVHNLVTGIVWPMRVVLYGLAIGAAVAVLLREAVQAPGRRTGAFGLAGAVAGTLPLISAHALVMLACAALPWISSLHSRLKRSGWLVAFGAGALVALPQVFWLARHTAGAEPGFVRWHPGWMVGWRGETPLLDLVSHAAWNTGVWLGLGLAGWVVGGGRGRRETAGWWLLFPLGYLVVFQPYVYDNLKLFAAGALAASAGCAWWLHRAWRAGLPGRFAAALLAILIGASGSQSIVSEWTKPAVIADAGARAFAEAVTRATPPDALILTGPQLHHPVLILAGRRVVAANPSGMTLHGVPGMFERTAEVARVYRGEGDVGAWLREREVGWVVLGPMERVEFGTEAGASLRALTESTLRVGEWELRRVRALPPP